MIFCSSCLPAAADAQFVECTSEQSHFIDGQPVFGLGLQEGENLHRGHPVSFLFIFGGMEVACELAEKYKGRDSYSEIYKAIKKVSESLY